MTDHKEFKINNECLKAGFYNRNSIFGEFIPLMRSNSTKSMVKSRKRLDKMYMNSNVGFQSSEKFGMHIQLGKQDQSN